MAAEMLPTPLGTRIFSLAIAAIFFLVALTAVRRRLFSEGYSALWMLTASYLVFVGVYPELALAVAARLGFYSASSMFFLFGIVFSIALLVIMTAHISQLRSQVRRLSHHLAITNLELERLKTGSGKMTGV